jgi:hypothetical protein
MAGIVRSKAVIVAAAALALVVLAGVTIARWQGSEDRAPQVAAVRGSPASFAARLRAAVKSSGPSPYNSTATWSTSTPSTMR